MLLVTTALEKTWGEKEKIFFLGEWCKLHRRRHIWGERKYAMFLDPWSDRLKREEDYRKLKKVYERFILELAKELNKIHKLDLSLRSWKIICGPWLKLFINSTYHKWICIEDLVKKGNKFDTYVSQYLDQDFLAAGTRDFIELMVSDAWNHHIFSAILSEYPEVFNLKYTARNNLERRPNLFPESSISRKFFINVFHYVGILFNKRTFIFNSYMNKRLLFFISLKLFSLPILGYPHKFKDNLVFCRKKRKELKIAVEPGDAYENFLSENISKHLPLIYLEGFKTMNSYIETLRWPEYPSNIVTASNHLSDDFFKFYAASKIFENTKLKLISHGGGFRSLAYSDVIDHEIDICDDYFTWGKSTFSKKDTRGYLVKKTLSGNKKNIEDYFVHILLSDYRYPTNLMAYPSYEQLINGYIQDQIDFLSCLDKRIRDKSILKLGQDHDNNGIKDMISDKLPGLSFSSIEQNFLKMINKAKVVVSTYNGTTLIESMASNKPTIVFWNPDHWELTSMAEEKFHEIKKCGIFHESATSAAKHLNEVWDNPDAWWCSPETATAKESFLNWFGRKSRNPVKEMAEFINR